MMVVAYRCNRHLITIIHPQHPQSTDRQTHHRKTTRMQRRLATAGLLAFIASASAPFAWAQQESDPLWEDIAAIEAAQQQQQAQAAAAINASSSPVLRVPLRRRSLRDVINAVLNRPRPTTTPGGLRGSTGGEPGEGDIIISDVANAQYFGEIQVGSQGQTFEVGAFCGLRFKMCVLAGGLNRVSVVADISILSPTTHSTEHTGHLRHGLLQPLGPVGRLPLVLLGQAQVRPRLVRDLRGGACVRIDRAACSFGIGAGSGRVSTSKRIHPRTGRLHLQDPVRLGPGAGLLLRGFCRTRGPYRRGPGVCGC